MAYHGKQHTYADRDCVIFIHDWNNTHGQQFFEGIDGVEIASSLSDSNEK